METKPFSFKNVNKGAPIEPNAVPKCPPAAMTALFAWQRKYPPEALVKSEDVTSAFLDIATTTCAIVLRRLDSSVKVESIESDEDTVEVLRLFDHIRKANPSLFVAPETPAAS